MLPTKFSVDAFQQLVRLTRQIVALGFFLAGRQQPDPRPLDAQPGARVNAAHHGELQQVRRFALDRRPGVDEDRRPATCRHRRRQRRSVDAGEHAKRRVGGDDRRSGVAGAHEGGRLTIGHQLRRNANRRAWLAPEGERRGFGHLDDVGRIDDAHVERVGIRMSRDLCANRVRAPHEIDTDRLVSYRSQCAVDNAGRRMIAAHRIDCNPHHCRCQVSGIRDQVSGVRSQGSGSEVLDSESCAIPDT